MRREVRATARGLDRVENVGTQTTRFARDGLGDTRRHEGLGEDCRGAGLAGEVGELPEAIGVRLLLGVDTRDRLLGEVVTASEVAEGLVRGDNRASRTRGQPAAVLAGERRELTLVARAAPDSYTPRCSGSAAIIRRSTSETRRVMRAGSSQTCGSVVRCFGMPSASSTTSVAA